MVAKLIFLRPGNFALTEESAPVEAVSLAGREASGAEVVRLPHYARHARTAEPEPPAATFLPIRSAERRRWSAELAGPAVAGLVLHGVGGIGKSALAAQIAERVGRLEPDCVTTILSGEVTADAFLAGVAAALRRYPKAAARGGSTAEAVAAADRTELPWAQRFALLRRHVLDQVPVLLVLDNFDDNLSLEAGTCTIRDPSLIELLTSWADSPHRGRVLITCRHRFAVPETAASRLGFRHLGPLSRSGAIELAMSLAALGLLGEEELDRAWRLLGGHPRAMEYLDALLLTGDVRFPALAERLAGAIEEHVDHPAARHGLAAPTELPLPTAETAALAVADLLLGDLFDQLSAEAQGLLIRASVYRAPVGRDVLLLPVGQYSPAELAGLLDECRATGLLAADSADDPPSVFVHRWTAVELHRRLAERQRGGEVIQAHRRAAEYWRWRITAWPHDHRAEREAGYHLLQVSDLTRQAPAGGRHRSRPRRQLRPSVLAAFAMAMAAFLAAVAVAALLAAEASSALSGGGQVPRLQAAAGGTAASPADAIRHQAAAWVASQVSGGAIVACDPAMCSALLAQGVTAGNLLVLRSAATDPLGSDVVMATAAVRSQFGARLASVYAPEVIASFGSGELRVDVRAVAPDGAAAFQHALAADLAARRAAGSQLLRNSRIGTSPGPRAALLAGQVDSRLLITLAALAVSGPLQIESFGGSGPGAGPDAPLRTGELAAPGAAPAPPASLRNMLAFVRAQRPPFLPARAGIVRDAHGLPVLSVEFAAPSPVGLLQAQTTPLVQVTAPSPVGSPASQPVLSTRDLAPCHRCGVRWPASRACARVMRASRSARKASSAARLASTVARRPSCRLRHSRVSCRRSSALVRSS